METTITETALPLLNPEEVGRWAQVLYERTIRGQVETPDNIGKMVIIDITTGAFGVDELGFDAADRLRLQNPNARLYGIRIGYRTAATLGGVLERTSS